MKTVRPFDVSVLKPGEAGPWLISPEDDAGCTIRARRGGGAINSPSCDAERYAVVIEGRAHLSSAAEASAEAGEVLFLPSGDGASVQGDQSAVWLEVEAPTNAAANGQRGRALKIDPSKFEGDGFRYQALIDRSSGAQTMRLNMVEVMPGAGSPDYHIHVFTQLYVIFDGELTIDVGRKRAVAGRHTLVFLPPGVVHRNFNAANHSERHLTLLVPEPKPGAIFDYAVTIHEVEAEIMTKAPEMAET